MMFAVFESLQLASVLAVIRSLTNAVWYDEPFRAERYLC